jgi:transcriptional regulator with XRE-family HTH domain
METQTIARDVRSRRLAAGLSQLELAQRPGCADSTIRLFDPGYLPAPSGAMARVLAVLEGAEADPSHVAA